MSERLGPVIRLAGAEIVPIESVHVLRGDRWGMMTLRCVAILVRDGNDERRIELP